MAHAQKVKLEQPKEFKFSPENMKLVEHHIAKYPKGRQASAVMPMLDIIEAHFDKTGGPWMLGAQYTIADAYLMMMCRWTRNMANPARSRPQLAKFLDTMAARPAVIRAYEQEKLQKPWY